ncbi:MAG: hypothetical protein JRN39_02335 [Nitrososphaerota archaeon]|nr:hypothetical protein [Nitrososphaerota archaeon]MDG6939224.1 hypothetical protein [Nitrososphaerota archaeon]
MRRLHPIFKRGLEDVPGVRGVRTPAMLNRVVVEFDPLTAPEASVKPAGCSRKQ